MMRPVLSVFVTVLLVTMLLVTMLPVAGCAPESADEKPAADAAAETTTASAAASEPKKLTPAPPTGDRSVEARLGDATLTAKVKMALMDVRALRVFDLDPTAEGRRVTLHGDVRTRAQRTRAAEVAQAVDGVGRVVNELTVEGQSVAVASKAPEKQPAARAAAGSGPATQHTVKSGESLWLIARRNGTTPEQIRQLNGLRSNKVKPGQRLLVPGGGGSAASSPSNETASSGSAAYHTVRPGESLWQIARTNGLSVERLKRLNSLRSNTVKPGQRLRVD